MTSNIGSQIIQEMVGGVDSAQAAEKYEAMKAAVMEQVGQHFRPEFINRVDEAVVFHPLGREQIRAISEIQVRYLSERLAAHDMRIEFSAKSLDKIGEAGFDPVYGARPLKRAIQQRVENPLAQKILAGEFGPGDTIRVDIQGEEIVFKK